MFGDSIREEVTLNLALGNFDPYLTKATIALVAFNPLTKYPLSINPVNGQIEGMMGRRYLVCGASAVGVLMVAITFPGFHHVMVRLIHLIL